MATTKIERYPKNSCHLGIDFGIILMLAFYA